MARKILDLTTLEPDRMTINIDGQTYEIRDREDMGLEEIVKLNQAYQTCLRIQNQTSEVTEEDAAELSRTLDKLVRLILLHCPEEVHLRLKDHHRMYIFEAFREAVGVQEPQPNTQSENRAARRKRRQTGAKQSQRSRDSMEATPKAG